LQSAKLNAKDGRATGLEIYKFLLVHDAISFLGEYLLFQQCRLHEFARLSEIHLDRPTEREIRISRCPPDAVGTCKNDGQSEQGRMPLTRVGSEALGLVEANQGKLSLLWGRLLHSCHILFLGMGTRCFSAVHVTSRENFPEYASALAHLHTLQLLKLVFLIFHKLW